MKKKSLLLTVAATLGLTTATMAQVPSYVPTNGLVGWWPFNGNANDESGNGNNGTVNGATLTSDRNATLNSAYSFDGTSNFINISNLNNIPYKPITYNLWMRLNAYNSIMYPFGGGMLLVGRDWSGYYDIGCLMVWDYPANNINNSFGYYIGQSHANANYTPQLNSWLNITMTLSSQDTIKFYVNGNLQSTQYYPTNSSVNGPFRIGAGADPNPIVGRYYFDGDLDDVGVWNRALTSCEIQDLYNAQLGSLAISAGPDQTVCSGNSLTLNASGGSNYQWNNNVLDGQPFTPTQSGSYIVSGTDSLGCIGSDTLTVTVLENASSTINQTALDSYTLNGQTYTQSGTYTQTIPAANGCDSVITLNLTLNFTGLSNSSTLNFSLFPNPATQHIQVNADHTLVGTEYRIFDNTGKLVLSGILNAEKNTIDVSNLAIGTYVFKVGENVKQSFKVTKQ